MRGTIFRTAAGLLGVAAVATGVTILLASRSTPNQLVSGLAIAGIGAYFLKYAITGRPTFFAHRLKGK
jgi:hypothetical protein